LEVDIAGLVEADGDDGDTQIFAAELGISGLLVDNFDQWDMPQDMPQETPRVGQGSLRRDGLVSSRLNWKKKVVVWKSHVGGHMLQTRCFSVEWRSSLLLDKDEFVRRMRALIGSGETVSYCVGAEVRRMRADYMIVVRTGDRVRIRDPRDRFLSGHGYEEGLNDGAVEPGIFFRIRVPAKGTDEGINAFVKHMKLKCEEFDEVTVVNETKLIRCQLHKGGGRGRDGEEDNLIGGD
jgi:hypothetical protein